MARIIEETLLGLEKANVIGFHDFSIGNRQLWDNLPDDIRKGIIIDGENIRFTNNDYIPLSLFRNFKATGNRKTFEDVYFAKRRKLSDAVIAECAENEGRFISVIEEGIWSLLSEPSWVIPAHNSYVRDTEQLDTPLTERPVLDLFACETGEILALTAAVLGRKLNPIILKNIYSELERRIAKPYIEDSFWWMGSEGPLINWSPWCTQNVLITVLSNPGLEDKTRMKAVKQAIGTLEGFIASYNEDGACDEGAGYYHAAALSLFGALLVLERSSGRDFSKVFRNQKIYNMASYIEDVFIADDLYLNYADCSPKAGTLTCREYLFAKAVGNDAMAHHAARDVAKYGWKESDNSYNLYYKLLALSSYNEAIAEASRERIFRKPPFKAFSRTDLAIYREDDITFAIKGGCNAESHNHNDVGSVILYKGTVPILVDIGVEALEYDDIVLINAPFTKEVHNEETLERFRTKLRTKGAKLVIIWVVTDPEVCHQRMVERNSDRDTWKLEHWDEYIKTVDFSIPEPLERLDAGHDLILFHNSSDAEFDASMADILPQLEEDD